MMKFTNKGGVLVTSFRALALAGAISSGSVGIEAQAGQKLIADGFVSPLVLLSHPQDSETLLVADQVGVVYVLNQEGERAETPFLDLRDRLTAINDGFDERGLLGLAFHPEFDSNRKFYVYYSAPKRSSAPESWDHTSHVSEFRVSEDNPKVADPDSERILLQVDQPQFNHDGGRIAFGPDGYLYIGLGDGGAGNDSGEGHGEMGNGQNIETLLGSILRIDVDAAEPYGIPEDNPFVGKPGRDEIYAYGLRNPWGISFDRGGSHRLFAVDVGQMRYEELNIIEKGGNYGWKIREGFTGFEAGSRAEKIEAPEVSADGAPLKDPVLAYKSFMAFGDDSDAKGISVTGGYVYRGSAIPEWTGKYIFADWKGGRTDGAGAIFAATESDSGEWSMETIGRADGNVVAFGQDAEGELYVLTNASSGVVGESGKVWKLVKD